MKKWIQEQKHFKDERGLTLVELLAVIVILAIVATIAFIAIGNVMENSKKDALVSNGLQMIESAKLYEATVGDIKESGVDIKALQDADVLENMYAPWSKKIIKTGKVSKDKDKDNYKYSVEITGPESEDTNLPTTTETDLHEKGRNVFDD